MTPPAAPITVTPNDALLDQTLRQGQRYAQVHTEGRFTNHATYAAEALSTLGLPEAAEAVLGTDDQPGWYFEQAQLASNPRPGTYLSQDDWQSAIGDEDRLGDFNEFFMREFLGAIDWRPALATAVDPLLDHPSADLFHGVIGVGHAVRSLMRKDTLHRRAELGRQVALWASKTQPMPARTSRASAAVSSERALTLLPQTAVTADRLAGTLRNTASDNAVALVVNAVELDGDPPVAMIDIARTMTMQFNSLAPTADEDGVLLLLHTVTGSEAALRLLDFLNPSAQRRLVEAMLVQTMALSSVVGPRTLQRERQYRVPTVADLTTVAELARETHTVKGIVSGVELYNRSGDTRFLDFSLHSARLMSPEVVEAVPTAFATLPVHSVGGERGAGSLVH